MAISRTKNGGKQSFNAPFSASHLEKTRISASDFVSQSRTNEKPPDVRRGKPKRIQNRQAFHCGNPKRMQNRQGFHCGNSKRMQNRRASSPCLPRHPSRTLPTNEWRKFIRFRNEWRKLAHYSAGSLPQTHADPPFVLKRKKTAGHSDRQDRGTHGDRVCQEVCVSPISLTGTSRFSAGPPRRTGAGCAPGTSRRDGSPRPTCGTAPAPSGTAASSPPPRWGTTPASRPCGNWR